MRAAAEARSAACERVDEKAGVAGRSLDGDDARRIHATDAYAIAIAPLSYRHSPSTRRMHAKAAWAPTRHVRGAGGRLGASACMRRYCAASRLGVAAAAAPWNTLVPRLARIPAKRRSRGG